MWVVGLTGGIGSGKSVVSDCFSRLGVPVIDADEVARELTAPASEALALIATAFGASVLQPDGTLNRTVLRQRVFADTAARKQLEAILHPRIRQRIEHALATLDAPYALAVIPLLVETGHYHTLLNRVLVVDCPETLQIERVMARNAYSRQEVVAILASQASRSERLAIADDVLVNTGSAASLCTEVARLHALYLHQAPDSP